MRDAYLVLYDYGTGGVWSYLRADSPQQIVERFPALKVYESPPEWMTDSDRMAIESASTFDVETAADADPEFFGRIAGQPPSS